MKAVHNSLFTSLSLIIGSTLMITACSKVNYEDGRTKSLQNEATKPPAAKKPNVLVLDESNSFEMKEGEVKTVIIKLKEPLTSDATIAWKIVPQEKNKEVNPADRFKQIEGSISALAGESELSIEIPAQDVDKIKQGDQLFSIQLTETTSNLEAAADLKLLDVPVQPNPLDRHLSMQIKGSDVLLSLDEAADEDVIVEIETQDQTAVANKDYRPIKMTVKIPKGQKSIEVPYELLKNTCAKEKTFLIVIKSITGASALNKTVQVATPADKSPRCKPTTTKS